MPTSRNVRGAACAAATLASVLGTALPRAAHAQDPLPYENTTFLHGLGSSDRIWTSPYGVLGGRTSLDYVAGRVYLRTVHAPWLNEGADGTKDRTPGLRLAKQRDNVVAYLSGNAGRHVLVGHSAGSLVARSTFPSPGIGPQRVSGIVTIAAPHRGALVADSATQALGYVNDMLASTKAAEGNVKLYLGALGLLSLALKSLWLAVPDVLTALELQGGGDFSTGDVGALPQLQLINDLGPGDSAIVALKGDMRDGVVPRANVKGSIPHAHALLRLAAAGAGAPSFEELKSRKDKGLSLLRKCRNMGNWTFNATDPSNKCQRAARMLDGLDNRWAAYVNGTEYGRVSWGRMGQVPRKVPFDGVVPNENSVYPSSGGRLFDYTVPGASHQDIYKQPRGLDFAAQGMLDIGMERGTGFYASLVGPRSFRDNGTLTWRATALGGAGEGSYSYSWSYRVAGSNVWNPLGSGPSASRYVTTGERDFDVRVTATSNGVTTSAYLTVRNNYSVPCEPPPGQLRCIS